MTKRVLSFLLVVSICPMLLFAGVHLKNGDFYISYTDADVPGGGNNLEFVRTYNSKATEVGWCGIGWGNPFETYVSVSTDGTIIVNENGSGAQTRFMSDRPVDAVAAAKKIVDVIKEKSPMNEKEVVNLVDRLAKDAEFRQMYERRFKVRTDLAVGTSLQSSTRGLQVMKVTQEGFERIFNDGKVEKFLRSNDEKLNGKLSQIIHKNGYSVNLSYDKNGNVTTIKDSVGKQLFFEWYANNLVKTITMSGGNDRKALYFYKGLDLVRTSDIDVNSYEYEYDVNHNMTKVKYVDGSEMTISYYPGSQFVSEVTTRTKETTSYKYEQNPKNPDNHYWTLVTKKNPGGKDSTNKYEYETKQRADGSTFTYRIATVINDVQTETVYNEAHQLPLMIKRGKQVTNFEYDKNGLLLHKFASSGEFVKLQYEQQFNKISRVENNQGWTTFDYDGKGNLAKAVNGQGKSVLLIYDRNGRITKMVDQDKGSKEKRSLSFTYNSMGKPVEIAMDSVGKINVAYDNYGEIKKVESKAGDKMALQVTQAFQSLLAIVKPAGVNLNM